MSLETTVKTVDFAKKLRDRLKKLQENRVKELAAYEAEILKWKDALAAWLRLSAPTRVKAITKTEIREAQERFRESPGFHTSAFFAGAPKPPRYPSDRQMRDIRNTLRHLGITGQTTIRVTTEWITKLLGEPEDQERER